MGFIVRRRKIAKREETVNIGLMKKTLIIELDYLYIKGKYV